MRTILHAEIVRHLCAAIERDGGLLIPAAVARCVPSLQVDGDTGDVDVWAEPNSLTH